MVNTFRRVARVLPLCCVVVSVLATPGLSEAVVPVIAKATLDVDGEILILEGSGFGSNPVVYIGSNGGAFHHLTVDVRPNSEVGMSGGKL
jgi:hypothetical protein